MTRTMPLATFSMPMVTIKDGIFANTWIDPLIAPQRAAVHNARRMETVIPKPSLRHMVTIIPDRAQIDPTLRSISPEISTNDIPIPIIATIVTCRMTLMILSGVRNTGRITDNMTISKASIIKIPISFQLTLILLLLTFSILSASCCVTHNLFLC